jgi:TetR/AcrR family transcriptional repressor of nem operon
MGRPSNREQILHEGLRVVQERGFAGASVRDIVRAAGVPQGSFTNHFVSKEAFCLEVLDLYYAHSSRMVDRTLANTGLAPFERIRAYIQGNRDYIVANGIGSGCLIGNFSVETSEHSEVIRQRVSDIYGELEASVEVCLIDAIRQGQMAPDSDTRALSGFVIGSLQGAILQAKVEHSPLPLERLSAVLFSTVLCARVPA